MIGLFHKCFFSSQVFLFIPQGENVIAFKKYILLEN